MVDERCYCGSGLLFADCCSPIIAGKRPAATAEALMRSRFTANVLKDTSYLLKSWHPSTRPQYMDAGLIPDWSGLNVVAVEEGQETDSQGTVEFRALYQQGAGIGVLHEKSNFVFENGHWFYIDGDLIENGADQPVKTGRNAPCPCGSGKKFKKCCLR